tara:strand:+ start:1068 stop:1295 length:228 start_codon:yes stop_codon:yes gene_type:complete
MKYIVKKIAMYGNQVMGEYTTHEAALAAKAEFKGDTFEEFFIEIVPINDNDRITGLMAWDEHYQDDDGAHHYKYQ